MAKRVTMNDIARECGVSQTLVSFVISGKDHGIGESTRSKVLETAARMGYRIPVRGMSRSIGILFDRDYGALSLSAALSGIYEVTNEKSYDAVISGCLSDFKAIDASDGKLLGYIIISSDRGGISDFALHSLPFMFVKAESRDASACGRLCAEALIDILEGRREAPTDSEISEAEIPGARSQRRDSVWLL